MCTINIRIVPQNHKKVVSIFAHDKKRKNSTDFKAIRLDFFKLLSYNSSMTTEEIINSLRDENRQDFPKDLYPKEQTDYVGYMERLFAERDMTVADLIPKMNYERTYVYHMLDGTRSPSRTFILRLAIVIELTYEETQHVLLITENPLLYARIAFDAVIIYALERHMDSGAVNDLLNEVGEKPLFWTRE